MKAASKRYPAVRAERAVHSGLHTKLRVSYLDVSLEGERTPERLQLAADAAARSGDLQTTIEYANGTRHTIQLWNEFRIWDPGD